MSQIQSEAQIRRYQDPEEHRKTSEAIKKVWERPGYKEMMSEALSEVLLGTNPEFPNGVPDYWWRLSRKVWQEYHGRKIPAWGLIHHWDWDHTNLDPKNLGLLKISHHRQIHSKKIKGNSLKELIPLLQENKIIGVKNDNKK